MNENYDVNDVDIAEGDDHEYEMMTINPMTREEYDRMFALGVSMYGQMTAGSYFYIGPQVIIIIIIMI